MSKSTHLMVDCVVFEDYCNLHCDYCYVQNGCKSAMSPGEAKVFKEKMLDVIRFARERNIPALKFSGGEIFLVNALVDILESTSDFERVQFLTNGTLLNKNIIQSLAQAPNVCVQVSLDGHTHEMNRYRFGSEGVLLRVLDNVHALLSANIPLEINLCLTRANIEKLQDFLEYLLDLDYEPITLYPINVKGHDLKYGVCENQYAYLSNIIEDYDRYQRIMPPRNYLVYLDEMLRNKQKPQGWVCWIPELVLAVHGSGDILACPGVSADNRMKTGSVLYDTKPDDRSCARDSLSALLKYRCRVVDLCRGCYAHYEVMNLYLNGLISKDELSRIWFFNNKPMWDLLDGLSSQSLKHGLLPI